MTEIWQGVKSARDDQALAALATRARHDLEMLNFPAANWVPSSTGPDGKPMLDALIVGGGMCGQTVAYGLMREGIRNIRTIDRNPRGEEGPWGTYARMEILRSPKTLTGPDLGVPSLTFRAWFEAQHGAEGWARLHKAGRIDWRDYLLWVRDTVGIAVENGTALVALEPTAAGVRATLESASGREEVWVHKVVLAGGRDGAGGIRRPRFPSLDGCERRGAIARAAFDRRDGSSRLCRSAHRCTRRGRVGFRLRGDGARSRRGGGHDVRAPAASAAGQQVEGCIVPGLSCAALAA